jgi:hypothetical protein
VRGEEYNSPGIDPLSEGLIQISEIQKYYRSPVIDWLKMLRALPL